METEYSGNKERGLNLWLFGMNFVRTLVSEKWILKQRLDDTQILSMKVFSFCLIRVILLGIFFAFAINNIIWAQSTRKEKQAAKESRIKKWIESENYVFIAQMALPMSGENRHLTSEYEVQVSKDTINSYLPFFGRAYSASMNPDDAGIKFISKDFSYTVTQGKKGWNISIRPNDVKGVELFTFFISEDGYASLQVTQTERQVISFNGYITGKNKK